MELLRQKTSQPEGQSSAATSIEGSWNSMYPGLCLLLSAERFPDGKARETSTLLIFCADGYVKLCLNERHAGETAWSSGRSLEEALESMERGLQAGSLQWRKNKPKGKR